MWVPHFPAVHPRAHLVLRLRGRRTEIGEHRMRIRFVDDEGATLVEGEGTVHFGEPPAGVTDVEAGAVLVFDLPLPRPGGYAFQISLDGGDEYQVPLSVGQMPGPAAGQEGGTLH